MHNGRMSLKALRTFEAVVRNRSMAKAADELYVSAGAIGFQIRALEAELGFRRFDGVGGEMLPTEAAIRQAPRVLLTPHVAGSAATSMHRMSNGAVDDMLRLLRGVAPAHPVNSF